MSSSPSTMARPLDNFDALRLVAALCVVIGHAYVLTGTADAPHIAGIRIDHLGLAVFFSVSGYLITQSWDRLGRIDVFLWHRALRIFPALWVVLVVTVTALGPLATALPVAEYARDPATSAYLFSGAVLAPTYDLPGVFTSDAHELRTVNGSLWTLGVEFCCYLGVLALSLALRRARTVGFAAIAVAAALASTLSARIDGAAALENASTVVVYFAIGALWGTRPRTARGMHRTLVLSLLMWVAIVIAAPGLDQLAAWLLLPGIVIAIGHRSWRGIRRAGRFGDLSYGIYLWGFPVQQLVIATPLELTVGGNIVLVAMISAAIAALSWHVVEKRALAAKTRPPSTWRRRSTPVSTVTR